MKQPATFRHHVERIRTSLGTVAPAPRETLANNSNAAAVLVPIFERKGDLHVLYIRRSDRVASHRGQVAFPGGRVDPVDATLLDAALREAHEEVNIAPATVEVIGTFPTVSTYATKIVVAPFVGVIPHDAPLRADPGEVAEIFDVPLAALRDARYRGEYRWTREGERSASSFPAILYGGQTIWGLTLRITESLLKVLDGSTS